MVTDKAILKTEAIFSDDREYRYLLKREWDNKKPKAAIIMTNPSISDMVKTDFTTMFITNNLVKLDYGAFDILNLIPKISTKINFDGLEIDDSIYDENIKYIIKSAESAEKIFIAWGSLSNKTATVIINEVLDALKVFENKLYIITNDYGSNKAYHPLSPQIRSEWILKQFELPKPQLTEEEIKSNKKTEKKKLPTPDLPIQESDTTENT
jgi:hypothetical protein